MDRATQRLRRAQWIDIIRACHARPEGQTAEDWLKANGINRKTYYYWQYRIRREAAKEMGMDTCSLPQADDSAAAVTFAEVPVLTQDTVPVSTSQGNVHDFRPDAVICIGGITVAVSNSTSRGLLEKIVEVAGHAR